MSARLIGGEGRRQIKKIREKERKGGNFGALTRVVASMKVAKGEEERKRRQLKCLGHPRK